MRAVIQSGVKVGSGPVRPWRGSLFFSSSQGVVTWVSGADHCDEHGHGDASEAGTPSYLNIGFRGFGRMCDPASAAVAERRHHVALSRMQDVFPKWKVFILYVMLGCTSLTITDHARRE